jgi:hypothetical protein
MIPAIIRRSEVFSYDARTEGDGRQGQGAQRLFLQIGDTQASIKNAVVASSSMKTLPLEPVALCLGRCECPRVEGEARPGADFDVETFPAPALARHHFQGQRVQPSGNRGQRPRRRTTSTTAVAAQR